MDWIDDIAPEGAPVILFGACDRHNFGDLLFPLLARRALATARPRRRVIVAGLVDRDLSSYGGLRTIALERLAAEWPARYGDAPADLVHVGGEILDCGAWEAAVMLQTRPAARSVVARLDADPAGRAAWARQVVGARLAPYVAPKNLFRQAGRWIFAGVGGADFDSRPADFRAEVIGALGHADRVTVRDRTTQRLLADAGVAAALAPDLVAARPDLLTTLVGVRSPGGEADIIAASFPDGYVAVQLAAAAGDDRTLDALAAALGRVGANRGWGIVLFRTGAAPWHDDPAVCNRLLARLDPGRGHNFTSLAVREIATLVGGARAYVGTSLHGRIVAALAEIPRVSLRIPGGGAKVDAWVDTWDRAAGRPVDRDEIDAAVGRIG